MKRTTKNQAKIRDIDVVDMLLIDHRFIKECIETLVDEKADKSKKIIMAQDFLDILQKHSEAEKKVIYGPLEAHEEFHFNILEAVIEHGIFDEKIKILKPKLLNLKIFRDELEAEFKVLAEMVKNHIKEEESELLPKMKEELEEETLRSMGLEFMRARNLSPEDIRDYPDLEEELVHWKDDVQKISSQFLSKMDKYVENLRH